MWRGTSSSVKSCKIRAYILVLKNLRITAIRTEVIYVFRFIADSDVPHFKKHNKLRP